MNMRPRNRPSLCSSSIRWGRQKGSAELGADAGEASVHQDSSTRSSAPVSSAFLLLIVVLLACAVWMLYRPDNARVLVFPCVLAGFLISLCLHEFGHAIVSYHCGDTTVEEKGYLTLNPLLYTDLQY